STGSSAARAAREPARARERAGASSAARSAEARIMRRADAGSRRARGIAASAAPRMTAPRAASRREGSRVMSAALLPGIVDELGEPVELVAREFSARGVDQGGDGLLDGAAEERAHDVRERALLGAHPRDRRQVDVALPLLDVADMPALLQEP